MKHGCEEKGVEKIVHYNVCSGMLGVTRMDSKNKEVRRRRKYLREKMSDGRHWKIFKAVCRCKTCGGAGTKTPRKQK